MAPASDNVWVGDLPVGMDKESLSSLFEAYGQIVESRVMPGKDPSAKVCAMIRFASVDMASWVVDNLNGNIPEGLSEPIICRYANAHTPKGGGKDGNKSTPYGAVVAPSWAGAKGGGAAKGGFVAPAANDNVWVGDLPVGTEQHDLGQIFDAYGQIVECRMLPGRDPTSKPCAMIRFANVDMATWVVENLNGNIPEGLAEAIICRYANSGGGKGGPAAAAGGKGGAWQQPWQQQANGGAAWGAGKGVGKKGAATGSAQALFQSAKGAGILGGGTVPDENQCFVKNLPPDTTDLDLFKLFAPFGAIPPQGVKAMMNADGSCKGIGFIDFTDAASAATAVMALDGVEGLGVSTKLPSKGKGAGKKGKA